MLTGQRAQIAFAAAASSAPVLYFMSSGKKFAPGASPAGRPSRPGTGAHHREVAGVPTDQDVQPRRAVELFDGAKPGWPKKAAHTPT